MTDHATARQNAETHCCPEATAHYHVGRCTRSGFDAGVAWGDYAALRAAVEAVLTEYTPMRARNAEVRFGADVVLNALAAVLDQHPPAPGDGGEAGR